MQQLATSTREQVTKLKEANPNLKDAEIGRIAGISRERVRQIIKPKSKKPDLRPKGMLKTRDVARLLNVHVTTVRRWSNQGKLKSCRLGPRGDKRFLREDIDAFLKAD